MSFTIKQARLFKDFSQKQMAERLGIHVQTYRKIESDPDRATVQQAKQISKIVGITYDQIFFASNSTLSRYGGV